MIGSLSCCTSIMLREEGIIWLVGETIGADNSLCYFLPFVGCWPGSFWPLFGVHGTWGGLGSWRESVGLWFFCSSTQVRYKYMKDYINVFVGCSWFDLYSSLSSAQGNSRMQLWCTFADFPISDDWKTQLYKSEWISRHGVAVHICYIVVDTSVVFDEISCLGWNGLKGNWLNGRPLYFAVFLKIFLLYNEFLCYLRRARAASATSTTYTHVIKMLPYEDEYSLYLILKEACMLLCTGHLDSVVDAGALYVYPCGDAYLVMG